MFPYEIANLISQFINIEYIEDMNGLSLLYHNNIIIYESLEYQTNSENININKIRIALKETDNTIRFKKLVRLNMYHAAVKMIHNNLVEVTKQYNEHFIYLLKMCIKFYDFDEFKIIATNNFKYKERCVPFKFMKYWMNKGDEEQQNFIAQNNKLFLSSSRILYEDLYVVKILHMYGFYELQVNLHEELVDLHPGLRY